MASSVNLSPITTNSRGTDMEMCKITRRSQRRNSLKRLEPSTSTICPTSTKAIYSKWIASHTTQRRRLSLIWCKRIAQSALCKFPVMSALGKINRIYVKTKLLASLISSSRIEFHTLLLENFCFVDETLLLRKELHPRLDHTHIPGRYSYQIRPGHGQLLFSCTARTWHKRTVKPNK